MGWYNVRIALPENSSFKYAIGWKHFKGDVQRVLWWSYIKHLGYILLQLLNIQHIYWLFTMTLYVHMSGIRLRNFGLKGQFPFSPQAYYFPRA